jgi:hypothetical protein
MKTYKAVVQAKFVEGIPRIPDHLRPNTRWTGIVFASTAKVAFDRALKAARSYYTLLNVTLAELHVEDLLRRLS